MTIWVFRMPPPAWRTVSYGKRLLDLSSIRSHAFSMVAPEPSSVAMAAFDLADIMKLMNAYALSRFGASRAIEYASDQKNVPSTAGEAATSSTPFLAAMMV